MQSEPPIWVICSHQIDYHANDSFGLRFQSVVATHWLNRSAGISKFNVSLGLSFSRLATAFNLFRYWKFELVQFCEYGLIDSEQEIPALGRHQLVWRAVRTIAKMGGESTIPVVIQIVTIEVRNRGIRSILKY